MLLVSGIMPTRGRPELAAKALQCFLAQSYPTRELIILDDLDEPSFPEFPESASLYENQVTYVRCERSSIPAKRNRCCALAAGEFIIHYDSDDHSAPERMADQVKRLEDSGKAVTGYNSLLFYYELLAKAYQYRGSDANYAVGTSLCYLKSWWESHPFDETKKIGEDNAFVFAAMTADRIVSVDGGNMMVARIHDGNTGKKHIPSSGYSAVPLERIPPEFFV